MPFDVESLFGETFNKFIKATGENVFVPYASYFYGYYYLLLLSKRVPFPLPSCLLLIQGLILPFIATSEITGPTSLLRSPPPVWISDVPDHRV